MTAFIATALEVCELGVEPGKVKLQAVNEAQEFFLQTENQREPPGESEKSVVGKFMSSVLEKPMYRDAQQAVLCFCVAQRVVQR